MTEQQKEQLGELACTYFPGKPIIQAIDRDRWKLIVNYQNNFTRRYIKRGFIFDGASIPRAFWRVVGHPMEGDILASALEHDAEYSAQFISKKQADERFLQNMEHAGVCWMKRKVFYYAVKFFGFSSWRGNKKTVASARSFVYDI